jgi:hypothetical protein
MPSTWEPLRFLLESAGYCTDTARQDSLLRLCLRRSDYRHNPLATCCVLHGGRARSAVIHSTTCLNPCNHTTTYWPSERQVRGQRACNQRRSFGCIFAQITGRGECIPESRYNVRSSCSAAPPSSPFDAVTHPRADITRGIKRYLSSSTRHMYCTSQIDLKWHNAEA